MKFGKEFVSQMVQEWQEAYMDYNYLKAILKDILRFRQQNASALMAFTPKGSLKGRLTLYKTFSGLALRHRGSPRNSEDEVILIHAGEGECSNSEELYQTMFLKSSEEGGEREHEFFKKLDCEFNKVNNFYRMKVNEVKEEAEELSKQMNALIALRVKVDKVVGFRSLASNETSNSASMDRHTNDAIPSHSSLHMDVIQEVVTGKERHLEDEGVNREEQPTSTTSLQGFRPASLEILNHVKINAITPETPVSTVKGFLFSKTNLSFSKNELRKAEEQMRTAMKEFYHKLVLLKRYSFLNLLAFSKIMKKYDKVTSRDVSKDYLKVVDNSYVGSSDEAHRLMEKVESSFTKHFTNGNRKKGMDALKPTAKRERHRVTFLLGLYTGCSLALIVALIVLVHARNILNTKEERIRYVENIFPLYSLFGYIILHMLMYSTNIYFWRRFKINYPFIFGFKQGTELGYREVLLLSSGLAVFTLAAVISSLDIEMDTRTKHFSAFTELVPLGLVLVNLPDSFLADQLTSQVQAFRSLEFYVCYYASGTFMFRTNNCLQSDVYKAFYFIIAMIPFWFRSVQCLRCLLLEQSDIMHGLNGLKYISTIVALAMSTSDELNRGIIWRILAATCSGFATIANTYWDIVIDWGLLRRNSRNPWLRDKLALPNKSVYFVAMVLNVLLRLAWMQSVLGIRKAPFLQRTALIAIVAWLEILRRGIWNFFSLENEHLNNVGKYRAFKSVPLPFNYEDDEENRAI